MFRISDKVEQGEITNVNEIGKTYLKLGGYHNTEIYGSDGKTLEDEDNRSRGDIFNGGKKKQVSTVIK